MITVEEALARIEAHAEPLPAMRVAVGESLGMVLAEPVTSDVDSPPHDKSLVDGYAVRAADLAAGQLELTVVEEVTAGRVPSKSVGPGTATRVMTGAPIPSGADAVIMLEQSRMVATDRVRVEGSAVQAGHNIMPRGDSLRSGEVVLGADRLLRPIDVGLLCETGHDTVSVIARPRVAILSTGDELVPVEAQPRAGQIRNSNGPMLSAAVADAGAAPTPLGIVADEPGKLAAAVAEGLKADVLLVSGGVSAGVRDLVPETLIQAGVTCVFHKLRLKPGKPLWFGVGPSGPDRPGTLVFGLPGNPIGGLVCHALFVRPALRRLAGHPWSPPATVTAQLTRSHVQRGDRATYWPAQLSGEDRQMLVEPLPWHGSADMRRFAEANALALFPPGERLYSAGEPVQVLPLTCSAETLPGALGCSGD